MTDHSTGEVLEELAHDALDEGRRLKESLTQRSATVITTSGVLVTLSLGASALATSTETFVAPRGVLVCVAVALMLLFGACVLALLNNAPWRQEALDLDGFTELAIEWQQPAGDLEVQAFALKASLARDLRASNRRRSQCLMLALALECAALVALSVGTLWILLVS